MLGDVTFPVDGLQRGVVYAARPGYRPLELDLHTPPGGPAPLIVFVHGGGWRVGSRTMFCPTWRDWAPTPFQRLVDAGFAVASVDYRLSGEATFPAQLDDVLAALDWLRGRPDVDADRMVLWGESAGGHLAALAGLRGCVRGVVDWYGPADLRTLAEQARPDAVARADEPGSREELLLGAPVARAGELATEASPVTHVHADAPPFHIAHGDADRFVPTAQSEQLASALRACGVDVELTLVPGADHLWVDAPDPDGVFDAALTFAGRVTA